jgi:anti-sigma factor RsiW
MTRNGQPSDAELNAYVDGELTRDDRRDLERRLADHGDSAAKVAAYQQIDDAIRARYAPVADEPVPAALASAVAVRAKVSSWASPRLHWRRLAAALALMLIGGAGGYVLRGASDASQSVTTALFDSALSAHAVYAGEVRHPVEVGADEEAHLVKWLTKRLGADIRAPALSASGFTLLGGRLLPRPGGPAAQFMYQDGTGRRLTMYVRSAGKSDNTAFQFADSRGLSAFYWIDQPLAYAIVGEISRAQLAVIARAAYDQLN